MIGRPLYKEAEDPEAFLTQSVVNHLESFKNEAPYIEEKEAAKFDDILFINHIDQTHKQRKSYNQHRLCIIQLQVDMKRQVLLKNQRYATQIQRRFSRHIHSPIHKKAQNDGWGRQRWWRALQTSLAAYLKSWHRRFQRWSTGVHRLEPIRQPRSPSHRGWKRDFGLKEAIPRQPRACIVSSSHALHIQERGHEDI